MSEARDDHLRAAMFAAVARLAVRWGDDLPMRGGLDAGFRFGGVRVPFRNTQKGIFRARRQFGPAALAIVTTKTGPYTDEQPSEDGWWYAYQGRDPSHADNRALRWAYELQTPLVHFWQTRPGWYKPIFPAYVVEDDPVGLRVHLSIGRLTSTAGSVLDPDPIPRRYESRLVRTRLHQARFRGAVVQAYRSRCAICGLDRVQLLDASHIAPDAADDDTAAVTNGIAMCAIHHRAFDDHLVGVTPGYRVEVSRRLLEVEDGPMLDVLKGSHQTTLLVPGSARNRPDRERLAARYATFRDFSSA